jgi:hypothetical protein
MIHTPSHIQLLNHPNPHASSPSQPHNMTDVVNVKPEQTMLDAAANENSIEAPPLLPTQTQDSQPSPSTAIAPSSPAIPDIYTKAKAAGNFSAPALPKPKILTIHEAATAALRRHWHWVIAAAVSEL